MRSRQSGPHSDVVFPSTGTTKLSERDHYPTTGAWRHLAIALAIAALIALMPATAAAALPAAALDTTVQFGVNTGVMYNSEQYTRAQIDQQLAAVAATGATVVRSDALWEDTEPQAPIGIFHRYNWTLCDEVVSSLAQHGLRWLPIIDYAAPWARTLPGQAHSPTSNVSAYAAYAAALASRYGPGGTFWIENPGLHQVPVLDYEIWNEPDNGTFWKPAPNAAAYDSLYSAAWSAIKAKQPAAQVLVGGLTRPSTFLGEMVAANPNIRNEIDGVAIHPYGSTPDRVFIAIRGARLAMNADGLAAVPLYITEVGWTTQGSGFDSVKPAVRPGYITEHARDARPHRLRDCVGAAVRVDDPPAQSIGSPAVVRHLAAGGRGERGHRCVCCRRGNRRRAGAAGAAVHDAAGADRHPRAAAGCAAQASAPGARQAAQAQGKAGAPEVPSRRGQAPQVRRAEAAPQLAGPPVLGPAWVLGPVLVLVGRVAPARRLALRGGRLARLHRRGGR